MAWVLKDTRPRAFLLENVEGLAFGGKDEGLHLLLDAVQNLNATSRTKYAPKVITLNAADYGVPQTRSRVFIVQFGFDLCMTLGRFVGRGEYFNDARTHC